MDRDAQPTSTSAVKPKSSRSPIERIVTWSFITVLLVVVGIEAQARFGHDRTVTQLRMDLETAEKTGTDLNLAAARQKVSGLAFQTDNRVNGKGRLTYRWPSLFKTYVVNLSVGVGEDVFALDTDAVEVVDEQPVIAATPAQPSQVNPPANNAAAAVAPKKAFAWRPLKGFAQPLAGIVAVATQDVEPRAAQIEIDPAALKVVRGVLVRELIRQAFLLSAHEELQQNVRDQSLGDDVGSEDKPQDYPYEVHADISPSGVLKISTMKYFADKPPARRDLEPYQLDTGRFYESLLAHVEELSRTSFPEFLRETGVEGQPNTFRETAEVPPETSVLLHKIDEMSQLTAIRELHALIRRDGESAERLAALARAYANLGSLTDNHWQLHHKVFKARALLYAQRLVAATKSSPWAVAHRGYAWALTGRLNTASEDFQQASAAQPEAGEAAKFPRWVADARAYCENEHSQLQSAVNDDDAALAIYLQLLLADPKDATTEYLKVAEAFLAGSPGCARAALAMGEPEDLGVRRMMAEGRLQSSWLGIYQSLQNVPGLPAQAGALIKKQAGAEEVRSDEPADRISVIRLLQAAGDGGPGPNPSVYGLLLNEISFLHAAYRIAVLTGTLGLPPDELVGEVMPTVESHPYADYLRTKVSDIKASRARFQDLLKKLKPTELDFTAYALIANSYRRVDPATYLDLWARGVRHHDLIQQDLLRELQYDNDTRRDKLLLHFVNIVAPQMPQSVAGRIAAEGIKDAEEAKRLETRFDRSPLVLQAIADWHTAKSEYDDALRCLQRRIEISPESNAYRSLANLYARKNDRAQWKSTLLAALETPSLGLEHATVQNELAHYHMHRNELQEALPYAEAAAQTYSAFGLSCAAECYERMGRMEEAEALIQACAERYDGSSFNWLFWCLRTGEGNERAAQRKAEEMVDQYRQGSLNEQLTLAIYFLTKKDSAAALPIVDKVGLMTSSSYVEFLHALLADAAGDIRKRDNALGLVRQSWQQDWVNAEFADLIANFLTQPEPAPWNEKTFMRLLGKCNDGDATNFYYFAGRFLNQHGQTELATEYLKLAASSPHFKNYNNMLAVLELKERGIEIPPRRPFELGGELADLTLVKDELFACWTAQQYDRIVELITQGLADHPEWSFLLVDRGQAHTRLRKNQEAIADFALAVEQNPDDQSAHHELAMILGACEDAALRDQPKSLVHAQRAFDLAITKSYLNYTCLAIAFAANGDFEKAVEWQTKAVQNWPDDSKKDAEDRLKLFQEKMPYVRPPRSP